MKRPEQGEYHPYFQRYVDLAAVGDFLTSFDKNTKDTIDFFSGIPDDKQEYRYAEGKWTPKQVLMHIIDTERVFAYRGFVASRLDNDSELQPYDDEMYARNTDVSNRSMADILEEFSAVRNASKSIFQNVTDDQSKFVNDVSGNPVSARAMGYIMMGHIEHHFNIVRERYLA